MAAYLSDTPVSMVVQKVLVFLVDGTIFWWTQPGNCFLVERIQYLSEF